MKILQTSGCCISKYGPHCAALRLNSDSPHAGFSRNIAFTVSAAVMSWGRTPCALRTSQVAQLQVHSEKCSGVSQGRGRIISLFPMHLPYIV